MRKGATGQVKVYSIVGLTSSAAHYVYRLDDPDTGEFYIGVRSCLGAPEKDFGYMGSGKWCTAHPDIRRVRKTIVRSFETREEAAAFEVSEIRRNSAAPLCANKQFRIRNSSAFDTKESRFSHERVPFSGHGTVIEPPIEPNKQDVEEAITFPGSLDTPQFREAWTQWIDYRREIKLKAYKPTSIKAQFKTLEKWGHDQAIAAIEQSIRQGWQGIFEPKQQHGKTTPTQEHNRNPLVDTSSLPRSGVMVKLTDNDI